MFIKLAIPMMPNSRLARLVKYGLYLTAFMPLVIFSDFLSPFHFGKIILFRAWIEILFLFYLPLAWFNPSYRPKTDFIFWAVTAFTVAFGLTTLTSVDYYQSFFGTLERMGGWLSFFHFWLFLVMLPSILKTKEEWLTFIKLSVWTSLLSTFYGFLQRTDLSFIVGSGGRTRIFGTLGNPALFAGYELLNVFLALLLVFRKEINFRERWLFGGIFLLDLLAVFMTAVRGSVLAVFISFILLAFLYARGGWPKKVLKGFGWTLGGVLIAGLLLIIAHNTSFVQNSGYLSRLSDVSLKTRTVNTRFWAWQAGLDGWNDSLRTIVFGWGPENFNLPFSKHFNPKFYNGPGSETLFDRGHNMFVEILVTMGLVGLLAYLAIFFGLFSALRRIFRQSPDRDMRLTAAILISGLVAYIIHNTFIFDTSANFLVFFTIIGLTAFLNSRSAEEPKNSPSAKFVSKKKSHQPAPVLVFVLLMTGLVTLVCFSIYQTDVKPFLANYAATRAIVASWSGQDQVAVAKFQKSMNYRTFGGYDVRHRYAQYIMENSSHFKDSAERTNLLLSAIEASKKNITVSDEDYLPYLYISRGYILLGKDKPDSSYNDLAVKASLRALGISPTFVRTYFEVAQGYLNKQDFAKASEYFEQAAKLNPEVGLSWWYWGATEIQRGHTDRGLELLQEASNHGYNLSDTDYTRLLGVYVKQNNFEKIALIYRKLIELSPKNPQYHASLAAAHKTLGQIDEAVKEAKEATRLDPSFEKEARDFIHSLGREF